MFLFLTIDILYHVYAIIVESALYDIDAVFPGVEYNTTNDKIEDALKFKYQLLLPIILDVPSDGKDPNQ